MAALTQAREYNHSQSGTVTLGVAASTTIYKGGMVMVNAAGFVVPCSSSAGAFFAGIALETVDNSSGSNGDLTVQILREGDVELVAAGMADADRGSLVYATDDNLVATSQAVGAEVEVGYIVDVISATLVRVKLKTFEG